MERRHEIDFAKGVLILLMVAFHLGYFHSQYPITTKCVYAFHMPGFLVISGLLFNVNKDLQAFLKSIKKIVIPYFVFETTYLLGLIFLGRLIGASNASCNSFEEFLYELFLHPIGTYWYLYTIAICMSTYFCINRIVKSSRFNSKWIVIAITSIAVIIEAYVIPSLKLENVAFFLLGVLLGQISRESFFDKFPSIWSIIPFIAVVYFSQEYNRLSLVGLFLTLFSLSFLLASYKKIRTTKVASSLCFVGRNTYSILLLSPIFTIGTKFYIPLFRFDSTAILWMIVSVTLVCLCCFLLAKLLDRMKIPETMWGTKLYVD